MIENIKRFFLFLATHQSFLSRNSILLMDNITNPLVELVDNFTLFQYLLKQPKYKRNAFYILNRHSVMYPEIISKFSTYNLIPIENEALSYMFIFRLIRTKYILTSFHGLDALGIRGALFHSKVTTVYTQHGVNFFKLGYLENDLLSESSYHKMIVSSKMEKDLMRHYFGFRNEDLLEAGLARWDLVPYSFKKMILIYFTSRGYFPFLKEWEQTEYILQIKKLILSKEFHQIIQKHEIDVFIVHHHAASDIYQALAENNISRIYFIKDQELGRVKQASSLLITDYSSICFDFMLRDRPVIFFRPDAMSSFVKLDRESTINNENVEGKNPLLYNITYNVNDALRLIEHYIHREFKLEQENKEKNSKFFFRRDGICSHIIEALEKTSLDHGNDLNKLINHLPILSSQKVLFSQSVPMLIRGFSNLEPWGRWSVSKDLSIVFRTRFKKLLAITIRVRAFLPHPTKDAQTIKFFINNKFNTKVVLKDRLDHDIVLTIYREELEDDFVFLSMKLSHCFSPKKLGLCDDYRYLGIGIISLSIHNK